jgi:hypothetical protein
MCCCRSSPLATRRYPRLREDLLEYVRAQLLLELGYTGGVMGTRADDSWCESVASISQALFKQVRRGWCWVELLQLAGIEIIEIS